MNETIRDVRQGSGEDRLLLPRRLLRLTGAPAGAVFLAQLIAWSDEAGEVSVSFKELQQATSMTLYALQKLSERGQALGWLRVESRGGQSGRRRCNRYRLNLDYLESLLDVPHNE